MSNKTKEEIVEEIYELLEKNRFSQITYHYFGRGDNGGIEEVSFIPPKKVKFEKTIDRFKDLGWELLNKCLYPGFEQNMGGYGDIVIKKEYGKVVCFADHNSIEVAYDCTQFSLPEKNTKRGGKK